MTASNPAVTAMSIANRRYPVAKVGDRFGDREVIAIVPREGRKRAFDERVRWRCVCGYEGETFTYNLRRFPPRCSHPEAIVVGTRVGDREVVAVIRERGRVQWRCVCGHTGETHLHAFRRMRPTCNHARLRIQVLDSCVCGHGRDDHRPRGGECLDDDCSCTAFRGAR